MDPERLGAALDGLREGLQILSPEWRYLYVNEAAAAHGRRPRAELLGRTMLECYPGIEKTEVFAVLDRCMRERRAETVENQFAYADGQLAWFELRIEPNPEGLLVLSLDISERKRLEASLRQAHKLQALGQMVAGVGHDLKNVLNPVVLQIEVLKRRLRDDADTVAILKQMSGVLARGAQLLDQMRDLGRQTPSMAAPVQLDAVAREAAELCRVRAAQHAGKVAIVEELGSVATVKVSPSELLSAIVNLVFNAVDAMPGGGRVTIRTRTVDQLACLEVEDDGHGMPPEVEARCLEPFFTTKGERGTGLGLATVYATVARHGGQVGLRTAVGRGTTVSLTFPPHDTSGPGGGTAGA